MEKIFDSQHIEHVQMVPVKRRLSDFDDMDLDNVLDLPRKTADIIPFESTGFGEHSMAERLTKWKHQEFKSLDPSSVDIWDIVEIMFAVPRATPGDKGTLSILLRISAKKETSVYWHVFRMLPRKEGGVTLEKVSNYSKVLIPIRVNGNRDVTESFGDWIDAPRVTEKAVTNILVYKAGSLERIMMRVSSVAQRVAKTLRR